MKNQPKHASRMKTIPTEKKSVLITGCSSGIGLATARLLRKRGWRVIPTVRKTKDIKALGNEGFEPILLDVADSESIKKAIVAVLERGSLSAIVNNAGFGLGSAMEDTSRTMFRDLFEVNVFGLQELTNGFIPVFRKQGYGHIINISSVLGEVALPFAGVYSASKYAVEALSDALRRELFDSGISVSIIQPGPIKTEFSNNLVDRSKGYTPNPSSVFTSFYKGAFETKGNEKARREESAFTKPPEEVAEKIFQCLESSRPKRRMRITLPAHVGAIARRALPAVLLDAIMIFKLRKKLKCE